MSTIPTSSRPPNAATRLFPSLTKYFDGVQQKRLVDEDLTAGWRVAGVLVAVITAATLAGIVTVLAIVLSG